MTKSIKIPILNIYFLLCYAWNKLEERDIVDIKSVDSTNLYDLFAKVLIQGINHLFKRGLDRGYIEYSEDSKCLKGKINFSTSIKRNLPIRAQMYCTFDELSHDILHNQIIKATCQSLIFIDTLDNSLRNELIGITRKLHRISDIKLKYTDFSQVQLNSNNSFYDFLLKICKLIYESLLVSDEDGDDKFRDFIQDDRKMRYVFEQFIRNFYKMELPNSKVYRENITWDTYSDNDDYLKYMPIMQTDTSIEINNQKTVIETKYLPKTFSINQFDKKTFHSNHLYQLSSYLKNLSTKGGINENCSGILLYPKVKEDVCEKMIMLGHEVRIQTIDLEQDWKLIHNNLLDLIVSQ